MILEIVTSSAHIKFAPHSTQQSRFHLCEPGNISQESPGRGGISVAHDASRGSVVSKDGRALVEGGIKLSSMTAHMEIMPPLPGLSCDISSSDHLFEQVGEPLRVSPEGGLDDQHDVEPVLLPHRFVLSIALVMIRVINIQTVNAQHAA